MSGKDRPGKDYYDQEPPYSGMFQARDGSRLQLDQWSSVRLDAKITEDTRPIPTTRFVRQAVLHKTPVAVTAVCRGTAFEVTSIKTAD